MPAESQKGRTAHEFAPARCFCPSVAGRQVVISPMKTIYEAANIVEADIIVNVLRQEGIAAHVEGRYLPGAFGDLPLAGLVRVVADEPDVERARAVVGEWEKAGVDQEDEAPPPSQPPRPPRYRGLMGLALGLILGIGGMYAIYRTPAYRTPGVEGRAWTYSLGGRPLKMEMDRNADHKTDDVTTFDLRGQRTSVARDDDFNGTFETRLFFRDDVLQYVDTDITGDGYPERRTYYKNDVPDFTQYLNPVTGLPYKVVHYRLGEVVYVDIDSDGDGKLDTRLTYTRLGEVATRQAIVQQAAQ